MMSIDTKKEAGNDIWMKHMTRYAIAMSVGIVLLIYVFPQLHADASKPMLISALLGGILAFGGGFGIAVSLFFHLWHKKS